jgi:hypothetical protein
VKFFCEFVIFLKICQFLKFCDFLRIGENSEIEGLPLLYAKSLLFFFFENLWSVRFQIQHPVSFKKTKSVK